MKPSTLNLPDTIQFLLRKKTAILLSGVIVAFLAFGVGRMVPLRYATEGNLIIEHPSAEDPKSPSVLNSVLTQVDVIQSTGLLRRAVRDLASTEEIVPALRLPIWMLDNLAYVREEISRLFRSDDEPPIDPDAALVTYIQKNLRVTAKENSSVISLRFEAGSPDAAAAVVNAIMSNYITIVGAAKNDAIAKADQWIAQQMASNWRDVDSAEQRVMQFMRESRNLTEMQGSPVSSAQLAKDKAQLALAREELARQQAALDTVTRSGTAGAEEVLASKSIQALKELEAKTLEQIGSLTELDPRRSTLQGRLSGIRAQIKVETAAVVASLNRNVQITRARVDALEAAVKKEFDMAQASTVDTATLKQLTGDLEAKRQLYVDFLKGAAQARLAAARSPSARILFQAVAPQRPAYSLGAVSIVLGFLSGTVGAAGYLVMRSSLGRKITSATEMAAVTGLPALGSLPDLGSRYGRNLLASPQTPHVVETFRGMWLTMRSAQGDGRAVLITSSEINEGKSTVAISLARSFANDGFRVLLIDADLRRPQLAAMLNQQPVSGLEDVLDSNTTVDRALVRDTESTVACLLSSGASGNPLKALSSPQFKRIVDTARQTYDFVLIDSAPVLHVADPVLLAGLCQYILFVVEAGRVPAELVSEATRRFAEADRGKIFTLLTRVRPVDLDRRDHYSGYAAT